VGRGIDTGSSSEADASSGCRSHAGGVTPARPTRRELLRGALALGAAVALGGCSSPGTAGPRRVGADEIAAADAARRRSGRVRSLSLVARPAQVDLGGTVVDTWAYGDRVPGTAFRASAGDRVRVAFRNDLPEPTSVHWHGLAIRNDMDGVPGLTTEPVPPGGSFDFDFVVPDPGTHWFHPHHGLQLDRGLYAPFVVDDPDDPGEYDAEWVLVLDDWTDGLGRSPEQIYAELRAGGGHRMGMGGSTGMGGTGMGGMGGMGMGGMGGSMGMAGGDVAYPQYLVNGRPSSDPDVVSARPGDRLRLRVVNASADTVMDVALGGHALTVTHSDGYPVSPVVARRLRIGMGERYDATVTLADGVFPLVASPVGKTGSGRALVRTGGGDAPAPDAWPDELGAAPLTVDALQAAAGAALPARDPDTVQPVALAGSMSAYEWTINGRTYDATRPLSVRTGQAGRLEITNHSMMSHPVHLHGHTFQVGEAGGSGPRKDTLLVPPMGGATVDLAADNPGAWLLHCHNAYHAEAGMITRLEYVS
jgi:FtsP/CotA-like multicopper oxidase with cupredoxin domain